MPDPRARPRLFRRAKPHAQLRHGQWPIIVTPPQPTTPQSANALKLIRNWSFKTAEVMTKLVQDPSSYLAARMTSLQDGSNPELLALFEKAGNGDQTAALQVQKIIAEEELGGREFLQMCFQWVLKRRNAPGWAFTMAFPSLP